MKRVVIGLVFILTIVPVANAALSIIGPDVVDIGETVQFAIVAEAGDEFDGWIWVNYSSSAAHLNSGAFTENVDPAGGLNYVDNTTYAGWEGGCVGIGVVALNRSECGGTCVSPGAIVTFDFIAESWDMNYGNTYSLELLNAFSYGIFYSKTITIGPAEAVVVSQKQFHFDADAGGPDPSDDTLTIQNATIGTLNWQIDHDCPWLGVSPLSGSLVSIGDTIPVALGVDTTGLVRGSYLCFLEVSDSDEPGIAPTVVAITLRISGGYDGGSGTTIDPYQIRTTEQFASIGYFPSDWNKHFILTDNIDMSGFHEKGFRRIGTSSVHFTGSFDGSGYTISNYNYVYFYGGHRGLFGYIDTTGEISNLGLENISFNASTIGKSTGLLAGYSEGNITNCYTTGNIIGITRVFPDGLGGLVGRNLGNIIGCYTTGDVTELADFSHAGGLVGRNSGNITGCYATGDVTGMDAGIKVGGLAGSNYSNIINCYATGNVSGSGEGYTDVGGLVGTNNSVAEITNCYSIGPVTQGHEIGGLVGTNLNSSTGLNSFWNIETSGQASSAGGTGKTTVEMKQQGTFTGWDFVGEIANGSYNYWRLCIDGIVYPKLAWQWPVGDITCPGGVELADLAYFASRYLEVGCDTKNNCGNADIDRSTDVGLPDVMILAKNWLSTVELFSDFVLIPAGEFEMGDHHDSGADAPLHTVSVDAFYMGRYKVTNQQYCGYLNAALSRGQVQVLSGFVYAVPSGSDAYCDTTGSSAVSRIVYVGGVFSVVSGKEDHPMAEVSWYGATAYCSYYGYRLPTEAEWEYAARGGNTSPYYRYPWGDTIDGSMANHVSSGDPYEAGDAPDTTPVGYYDGSQIPAGSDMANGYGLYDMAGNVFDWCSDWYDSGYYSVSPTNNPTGPASGTDRVNRGGAWARSSTVCTVARRDKRISGFRTGNIGFRIALSLN